LTDKALQKQQLRELLLYVCVSYLGSRTLRGDRRLDNTDAPKGKVWPRFKSFCQTLLNRELPDKVVLAENGTALSIWRDELEDLIPGKGKQGKRAFFSPSKWFVKRLRRLHSSKEFLDDAGTKIPPPRRVQASHLNAQSIAWYWEQEGETFMKQRIKVNHLDELEDAFGKGVSFKYRGDVFVEAGDSDHIVLGILPPRFKYPTPFNDQTYDGVLKRVWKQEAKRIFEGVPREHRGSRAYRALRERIPEPTESGEPVKRQRRDWVLMCGTIREEDEDAAAIAAALGEALAPTDFFIFSGGLVQRRSDSLLGAEGILVNALADRLGHESEVLESRIGYLEFIPRKPGEEDDRCTIGRCIPVDNTWKLSRRLAMVRKAAAVLSLGGDVGTDYQLALAKLEARPFLPLRHAGGASQHVWERFRDDILAGFDVEDEALEALARASDPDEIAAHAVAILQKKLKTLCYLSFSSRYHPTGALYDELQAVARDLGWELASGTGRDESERDSLIRASRVVVADLTTFHPEGPFSESKAARPSQHVLGDIRNARGAERPIVPIRYGKTSTPEPRIAFSRLAPTRYRAADEAARIVKLALVAVRDGEKSRYVSVVPPE